MKKRMRHIAAFFFCLCTRMLCAQTGFETSYPQAYLDGLKNSLDLQSTVDSVARPFAIPSRDLLAIAFPEMTRYSLLRDKMETAGLEILYVNYGKDYADFSIGIFQMKPSFAEEIEAVINSDTTARKNFGSLLITARDEKTERATRITRLKEKDWQCLYLCAFYRIVEKQSREIAFTNVQERICYFATAYNYGFRSTEEEIRAYMTKKLFPATSPYPEENFSYGEIAAGFYTTCFK